MTKLVSISNVKIHVKACLAKEIHHVLWKITKLYANSVHLVLSLIKIMDVWKKVEQKKPTHIYILLKPQTSWKKRSLIRLTYFCAICVTYITNNTYKKKSIGRKLNKPNLEN